LFTSLRCQCLTHTPALREYLSTGRFPSARTDRRRGGGSDDDEEEAAELSVVEAIALHAPPSEGALTSHPNARSPRLPATPLPTQCRFFVAVPLHTSV
jgi:hypothetical protein